MKQALLYKFNPQQMLDLLTGRLSIAVFKRDLPQWVKDKLARGEKVIGYGYCTKGKPYLYNFTSTSMMEQKYEIANVLLESQRQLILNGLVVVKFEVSGSDLIDMQKRKRRDVDTTTKLADGTIHKLVIDFVLEYKYDNPDGACLTDEQLHLYGNGDDLYAHHITNTQPVNMELGEFEVWYGGEESFYPLKRASQSFQTVWVKGE